MPQADILGFQPTLLLLPVVFFVGYYFFATVWVPRLLLTLRARAWLTQTQAFIFPLLAAPGGWPELFLMFVQFAGLVWVLSTVGVTPAATSLPATPVWVTTPVSYTRVGGHGVENFFLLWTAYRQALFFAPAATQVTHLMDQVCSTFAFYTPGKQFPFLLSRLRQRLPTLLSETAHLGHG